MEKYIFMNQDKEVLKFEFDKDLNVITKIDEIYNLDYAPLNIKNISRQKVLIELNNWFNDRGLPVYRDNAKEILEIFSINSVKELINRDYALSVSDQYWFKPEGTDIQWSDINYFDKNYDSISFVNSTFGIGASDSLHQGKQDRAYYGIV